MDNWLKFLIGSACVVVIAGGAHFAWGKYSEWSDRKAIEKARTYLFNRAQAKLSEHEKVHNFCKVTLSYLADTKTDNPFIQQDGAYCRIFRFGNQ